MMPEWLNRFPYFLHSKPEFGHKEFMIQATASAPRFLFLLTLANEYLIQSVEGVGKSNQGSSKEKIRLRQECSINCRGGFQPLPCPAYFEIARPSQNIWRKLVQR